MRSSAKHLWSDQSGAIAAVYALALPALIAVGGVAFDYARMAALDTELQNAADQAALAAATQLDGKTGACARAVAAARTLITNQTLMANDSNTSGLNVAIADQTDCGTATDNIKFYSSYTNATTNTRAYTDINAKFVGVTVNTRQAVYALTPIVAAFNSGDLAGTAVAGLGSAICKVPPVMICNPDEATDPSFTTANYVGKGLKLVSVGGGNGAWAPGNFGYLDVGSSTSNPNTELRQALGWVTAPGDCSQLSGVQTRTGAGTVVTQALNTRFDIYERPSSAAKGGKGNNGNDDNASCPGGGVCPPSINTVKDVVRKGNAGTTAGSCGLRNNEWELPDPEYLPTSATAALNVPGLPASSRPQSMGHPRDMCHSVTSGTSGYCTGPIGNGTWDRDAYFFVNYGWTPTQWQTNVSAVATVNPIPSPATTPPTRYRVYQWEIDNRFTPVGGRTVLAQRQIGNGASAPIDHDSPICSPYQLYGPGLIPGGSTVDRRRVSAAVINCTAQSVNGGGGSVYTVQKWIEFFLVEPSLNRERTDANDVYVEVIGETSLGGGGGTAGQVTRRDVPYLIE